MIFTAINKQNTPNTSERLVTIGIVTMSGSSPFRQERNAIKTEIIVTKKVNIPTEIRQTIKKIHAETGSRHIPEIFAAKKFTAPR